jgi:hypothetical protein
MTVRTVLGGEEGERPRLSQRAGIPGLHSPRWRQCDSKTQRQPQKPRVENGGSTLTS